MAQSELSGQVPSQVDKPENDSVLGGRERSRTSPAAPTPWAPTRQATWPGWARSRDLGWWPLASVMEQAPRWD